MEYPEHSTKGDISWAILSDLNVIHCIAISNGIAWALLPHSEHRFPAPSSKLCQIWWRHWRGTLYLHAAVYRHSTLQKVRVLRRLWKQPSAKAHTHKHGAHLLLVKKKEFQLSSNDCGFICAGVNFVSSYKWHTLFYELFVTNLLLFERLQKTARELTVFWNLWRN